MIHTSYEFTAVYTPCYKLDRVCLWKKLSVWFAFLFTYNKLILKESMFLQIIGTCENDKYDFLLLNNQLLERNFD